MTNVIKTGAKGKNIFYVVLSMGPGQPLCVGTQLPKKEEIIYKNTCYSY